MAENKPSSKRSSISSGTSNDFNTFSGTTQSPKVERETFVSVNLNELSKEASQGEGVHLRGLAEMIGCGNEIQFELFAAVAQMEHSEIFSDNNGSKVTQRLLSKLKESNTLDECLKVK
jgi:hypothetical protein